jgi:hypothetical protein
MEDTNTLKLLFSPFSFSVADFLSIFSFGYLTMISVKGLKYLSINEELGKIRKEMVVI